MSKPPLECPKCDGGKTPLKERVYGLNYTDFEMHLDEVLELEMSEEEKAELWDLITQKMDASPAYEALDEDIRFYLGAER